MARKPATAKKADLSAAKRKTASKPKPAPRKAAKTKSASEQAPHEQEPSRGLKLTLKQERFCQAYIANGGNATEAYKTAYGAEGYAPKTLNEAACRLSNLSKVSARIDMLASEALAASQVTVDRIVAEYAKLAFSNMDDFTRINADGLAEVDFSNLTRDQKAAMQEIRVDRVRTIDGDEDQPKGYVERVTFKLADKKGALADLGKFMEMFKEKHVHDVSSELAGLLKQLDGNGASIV